MMRPSMVARCLSIMLVAFVMAACPSPPPRVSIDQPSASECPTQGSRTCKESDDCGPGIHCTGGRCFANHLGCPCSDNGQCGKNAHCGKGTCFGNGAGAPCATTADCGERAHCTGEVCYPNETGAPCSNPGDCGAGSSCVAGSCN